MIRVAWIRFLGRNIYNFPAFKKHSSDLPKQTFAEFTTSPNKVQVSNETQKEENPEIPMVPTQYNTDRKRSPFRNAIRDISISQKRHKNLYNINFKEYSLQPNEAIEVLSTMAAKSNRPVEYLKHICHTLTVSSHYEYNINEISRILHSLGKLSFFYKDLIELLVKKLQTVEDFQSPKFVSFLIQSLAQLRYRDTVILERLLAYENQSKEEIQNAVNSLLGVAVLNYYSPEVEKLIKFLDKFNEVNHQSSKTYLNFIWSCILLNKEDMIVSHISKVLGDEFPGKFVQFGKNVSLKWKLLNVNGAAQIMPSYDGPLLQKHPQFKTLSMTLPKQVHPFLDSVKDALTYIFPNPENLKTLVQTDSGFFIDFHYQLQKKVESKNDSKNTISPKIGIILVNFKDVCSDGTLTGLTAFKLRVVKGLGYKVAAIRYDEFPMYEALSEKISFLKKKITALEKN